MVMVESENPEKTCLCSIIDSDPKASRIRWDWISKLLFEVVGCYFFQMALGIAAAFPDNSTNMITDTRHK